MNITPIPCHPVDSHRFVYVEIPKTGCTSIKHALSPFVLGKQWPDENLDQLHEQFGYTNIEGVDALATMFETIWKDYFKFTLVRHPVTRFKSFFHERIDPSGDMDINDFICTHFNQSNPWFSNTHAMPQTSIIGHELDAYDYVGRTESFQETEETLSEFFPELRLPHLNKSNRLKRPSILTEQSIKKFAEIFRPDFEALGYSCRDDH